MVVCGNPPNLMIIIRCVRLLAACSVLCLVLYPSVLSAQVSVAQPPAPPWQVEAGGEMAFDVASIKENHSASQTGIVIVRSNISLDDGDEFSSIGGLVSISDYTVATLITFAYKLSPSQSAFLHSELPEWALSKRYDVEARGPASATKNQFRLMMQSLLAERFHLAVHLENRQTPVFNLVLAQAGKIGPNLVPHSDDPPCDASLTAQSPGPLPTRAPQAGGLAIPTTTCGRLLMVYSNDPGGPERVFARNVTMQQIADGIRLEPGVDLERVVQDASGLSGKFDFLLEFVAEPRPGADAPANALGPTLLEALKEQLGFKLVPATAAVTYLAIDHIEEPSAN